MIERERKFLVTGALPHPNVLQQDVVVESPWSIQQAYLRPNIRIRVARGTGPNAGRLKASLTVKHFLDDGAHLTREEHQCEIPYEVAKALMEGLPRLSKTRTRWGPWEHDVFVHPQGLQLLEIELSSETDDLPPFPPGLTVITEVTHDPRYLNANLINEALVGV